MENAKHRSGWVIFSLFVWFHLVQSIFPLPYQRVADIETQANEAVENSNALAEKGFERDEYMQWTNEEWEEKLTASYWFIWVKNFLFLLFGLVSTFFLYKNFKIWPVFLGVVSIICFADILLSYADLDSPFTEWIKIMKFSIEKRQYLLAYYSSIWPLYLVILFVYSIWRPLVNGRKTAA